MVLLGVIIPMLMVIMVIESTLFIGFVSYIVSIIGLFLGMWGTFSYARVERFRRKKLKEEGSKYKLQN